MDRLIITQLSKLFPEEDLLEQEPMSRHTTFRVGGPASCFLKVSSKEQLTQCLQFLSQENVPYFLLGNGSNLLVSDNGFAGVVLSLGDKFDKIALADGNRIVAQAGALNGAIATLALKNELTGFEFAAGIPGTIGGGMRMNAGAYGGEMKDIVESVEVLLPNGECRIFSCEEMLFSYRQSVLKENGGIALSVTLQLQPGNASTIQEQMKDLAQRRRDKQPLEYPSAGSTFKRPEGYFAGKLIQDSGLKGYQVGGARVSEKHSGFVINAENATAQDVYRLIRDVQEKVQADSGVLLQPEVEMLGDFE